MCCSCFCGRGCCRHSQTLCRQPSTWHQATRLLPTPVQLQQTQTPDTDATAPARHLLLHLPLRRQQQRQHQRRWAWAITADRVRSNTVLEFNCSRAGRTQLRVLHAPSRRCMALACCCWAPAARYGVDCPSRCERWPPMGGIITVMVTSRSTCRGELSQTESVNSDYTIVQQRTSSVPRKGCSAARLAVHAIPLQKPHDLVCCPT